MLKVIKSSLAALLPEECIRGADRPSREAFTRRVIHRSSGTTPASCAFPSRGPSWLSWRILFPNFEIHARLTIVEAQTQDHRKVRFLAAGRSFAVGADRKNLEHLKINLNLL